MTDTATSKADIRNNALGMLSRREHSVRELHNKLKLRGYPEADIAEVLSALQAQGLQSDSRYTEMYVHNRVGKGYGPLRIMQELTQRGIGEALAQEYLQHDSLDWRQLIKAVRCKKFGNSEVKEYKEQSRQSRFLQHRGFTGEQIRDCFRDAKS
ncbi:MAG: regulatory protein RecX [Gammaproteobacteria bacterium]